MTICPNCGNENRDEALFCLSCGLEIYVPERGPLIMGAFDNQAEPEPSPSPDKGSPTGEETDLATSLIPGTIIMDRYLITEMISGDGDTYLYRCNDLLACWNCQSVQPDAISSFCDECGAELNTKPACFLQATISETPETSREDTVSIGKNVYKITIMAAEPEVKEKPLRLRYLSAYQSDTGLLRDIDEDSTLVLEFAGLSEMQSSPTLGFYAVADGIGGHQAGEVASRITIHTLAQAVMRTIYIPLIEDQINHPEETATRLVAAVLQANQSILDIRHLQTVDSEMGCTLTAALLNEDHATIVNVGDSRTYWMHNGQLRQVTKDHSVIAQLLQDGQIMPTDVYRHDKKGVIHRSLGDQSELEVDTFQLEITPGDRLLLCCDGLWEMVSDLMIEDILLEQIDPQTACNKLVEMAKLSGGEDNISSIIVNIQPLDYVDPPPLSV